LPGTALVMLDHYINYYLFKEVVLWQLLQH
jgi:hypothetical protein